MGQAFLAHDVIKKYLGIRFEHMGRDPRAGLDCYGLIKCVYRDFFETDIIDVEEYATEWHLKGEDYFLENYARQFEEVDMDCEMPRPGDIVLFNCSYGTANHAGIVLDRQRFIHAAKAGVIVSKFTQRFWKEKVVGFYRIRKAA